MKLFKQAKLLTLCGLLLLVGVFGTIAFSGGAKAASLSGACKWSIVASPNGPSASYLSAVAGVASNDVWAVGTQVQHWNGKQWSIVNANLSSSQNLYSVAAVSSTDVWAVGEDYSTGLMFAEQWNGTQWNMVAIPNPANSTGGTLTSIAAVSASDIWAVGDYYNTSLNMDVTLIEQWNGSQWSIVASPNPGSVSNWLSSVSAVSANDVWAVGSYDNAGKFNDQTLVEHYNGTQWSVVASPNPANGEIVGLNKVSASAQNNAWAVGNYLDPASGNYRGLIEHWNGTAWTIAAKPTNPNLFGVVAISAKNAWIVGSNSSEQTFTEHWNGQTWSVVHSPSPAGSSELVSVTHIPGSSQLWAVGIQDNGGQSTLTEVYC